jgi:hypothetical protein
MSHHPGLLAAGPACNVSVKAQPPGTGYQEVAHVPISSTPGPVLWPPPLHA